MEYQGTVVRPEDSVRAFFNRVYGWMAGGLALTAFIAWFVSTSQAMQNCESLRLSGFILP